MFLQYSAFIFIIIQLFYSVSSQYRFDCPEEYCSKQAPPCSKINCKQGRVLNNATKCGCCDICVKSIGKGKPCDTKVYGKIPKSECGSGLVCEKSRCVPAHTQCMKDLELFKEIPPFGKTKPECDHFGFYKPVVCISDVLCFCVDKDGNRIFGTDIASRKDSMFCNCSRDFEEFPRKDEIPQGNFLRCLPNGNYDALQCTDESCYCVGDERDVKDEENYGNIRSLLCYSERHKEDHAFLRSKCWHKRQNLLKQIKEYGEQGITVIGVDIPSCDLDGSYSPIQCKKDSCYCVKKNGKIIESTKVKRISEEAFDMTCRCEREKEMLQNEKYKNKNMQIFENFNCTSNGNYATTQYIKESKISVNNQMGYQVN